MDDKIDFDWASIAPRLLAPAYVWIVEGLRWIDQPLTAVEIARVIDRPRAAAALQFNLRQLMAAGGIEVAKTRRVRGVTVRSYRLARRDDATET
jgi:hypothetical protein